MKLQLTKRNKKGFTLIELMVVIAILATLAAVGYGPIMEHMGDGDRQAASSNMTNVHTALVAFKQSYGAFPCDTTAERLQGGGKKGKKGAGSDVNFGELTGDFSNPYFRQLLVSDKLSDEKVFYAKVGGTIPVMEGDNKLAGGKALEPGENAYAYVVKKEFGKDKKETGNKVSVVEQTCPLMICGVAASDKPYDGDEVQLDMGAFRKHVFVLTVDGRVADLKEKEIYEDDDEDITGLSASIFPENRKGSGGSTGGKYLVLPAEK